MTTRPCSPAAFRCLDQRPVGGLWSGITTKAATPGRMERPDLSSVSFKSTRWANGTNAQRRMIMKTTMFCLLVSTITASLLAAEFPAGADSPDDLLEIGCLDVTKAPYLADPPGR